MHSLSQILVCESSQKHVEVCTHDFLYLKVLFVSIRHPEVFLIEEWDLLLVRLLPVFVTLPELLDDNLLPINALFALVGTESA